MNKETIFAIIVVIIMILGAVYVTQYMNVSPPEENGEATPPENGGEVTPPEDFVVTEETIQCFKDAGVLIYGSQTCPYCTQLVEDFGGIDLIKPIYFDCSGLGDEEDSIMCSEGMQTGYVPEIQINGEVYQGSRSPQSLAERVGCEI